MLKFEKDNEKIGRYLNSLIEKKGFKSVRAFCIAYLELNNQDTSDDLVANMQNRMSQIIKGKKAVQLHDLPLFCELLGVSCEEILSVGKHYEPISGHVTNYEIAFSHDKDKWDKYINREDMLEKSINVQSGDTLNTENHDKRICFQEWSVAERRKTDSREASCGSRIFMRRRPFPVLYRR